MPPIVTLNVGEGLERMRLKIRSETEHALNLKRTKDRYHNDADYRERQLKRSREKGAKQ